MPGAALGSLDAIHLAAAALVGADLKAIVTYDQSMTESATGLGYPVEAPN